MATAETSTLEATSEALLASPTAVLQQNQADI